MRRLLLAKRKQSLQLRCAFASSPTLSPLFIPRSFHCRDGSASSITVASWTLLSPRLAQLFSVLTPHPQPTMPLLSLALLATAALAAPTAQRRGGLVIIPLEKTAPSFTHHAARGLDLDGLHARTRLRDAGLLERGELIALERDLASQRQRWVVHCGNWSLTLARPRSTTTAAT